MITIPLLYPEGQGRLAIALPMGGRGYGIIGKFLLIHLHQKEEGFQ